MTARELIIEVTRLINLGEIEAALAFYHEDVIQRSPDPSTAGFRIRHGKQALRDVLCRDIKGETRVEFRIERVVEEGDVVAVEGVNVGSINGRRVEQPVALFYDLSQGKIQRVTIYYDRLGLRRSIESGA